MNEEYKYLSEIEKYDIININNGEKYGYISNNDIIIDENGFLKKLMLKSFEKRASFWGKEDISEIPWEYIKKIGSKTVIIDVNESEIKKSHL